MNKLLQKLAKLTLGLAMAAGVGVAIGSSNNTVHSVRAAALGSGYTKITSVSSLATNDKVVIYNDTLSQGVTGMNTSTNKDVTISATEANWVQYVVTKGTNNFTLKDGTNYINAAEKTIKYGTATNFTVDSNGTLQTDTSTAYLLQANGSYYRPYKANANYSKFYVYKVNAATYTVSYNANAGTDTVTGMPNQETGVSAGNHNLSDATPVRSGYTFLGWGETAGATQTVTSINVGGNVTVYAIWQVASTPAVTVSPTEASGYRGQTVTLTATPNAYITPEKYVWTTTNSSIAKLGSSSSTSVETSGNTIVVTYGGDSADSATVTVKGVDETNSKETAAVSCTITVTASAHSITLSPNTAQSLAVGGSVNVQATSVGSGYYSSVNVTATTSDSTKVTVDGGTTATKTSGSTFAIGGVASGNAIITFTTTNGDSETISVSVEPSIYGTYHLCTSDSDLEEGAFYIIGTSGSDGEAVKFMSTEVRSNNKGVISAAVSSSQVDVDEVESGENVMVVKLGKSGSYWTLTTKNYSDTTQGYLGSNASSNQLKLLTTLTDNAKFDISIDSTSHVMTAEAQSGASKFIRYNSSNNPPIISCYSTSSSQAACYLYKQIDVVPIDTLTIPETYGSGGDFYEGQEWTVSPTYNSDATTKTSELEIVSGGNYIEVDGLKVTAKVGAITSGTTATATVKAVATDGSGTESGNCIITITKASVTGVEVTNNPTKVSYVEGQTLDLSGMVTTLTWNHGGTTTLSGAASGLTTTPSLETALSVALHNGIEVSVTYAGITSAEGDGFEITVVAKAVSSIKEWTGQTTSYAIDSKLVADGNIIATYNDGTESEPLSVATLWANSEVTFKLDGTTVSPGTTVLTSSDNGKSLTITYGGHQKSTTITVRAINYQFLTRITSTADLVAGETYIIVGFETVEDVKTTYVMSSEASGKPAALEWSDSWHDEYEINSATYEVDSLRADLASYGWTLGGEEDAWTFTSVDGKALGYGTSGTNFVADGTNSTYKITAQGTNGYWKVQFNYDGATRGIVFRGGTTMAFAPYALSNVTSDSDYHFVEIYRVYNVATSNKGSWENNVGFINEINCNSGGSYTFNTGKSWATMSEAFNDEDYDIEVRAYLKHASYSYDGSDTSATFGTDSDVADFVCMYDYIVDKYGWTDFIGRNGTTYDLFNSSAKVSPLVNIIGENTNTVAIIVIISMVSVTAIGGYFFLRKRKEQ